MIKLPGSANTDQARKDNPPARSNVAVFLLILSGLVILILSILVFNEFTKAAKPDMLPVSIRADARANYEPEATRDVFPQINKNILNQIIMEIAGTGNPQDRRNTLEAALLTPVQTMTPDSRLTSPAVPTSAPAEIPTQTPFAAGSFAASSTPNLTQAINSTYTPTLTGTFIPTLTRTSTSVKTRTSTTTLITTYTPTMTRTNTIKPSYTVTPSKTPTATYTFTSTPINTLTLTTTSTKTQNPTVTSTLTSTPTFTVTPGSPVACNPSEIYFSSSPNIYFNNGALLADITNNFPSAIKIVELHLDWQDAGPTRLDFIQLGGSNIWDSQGNLYDNSPPTDIAVLGTEFTWDSSNGPRTINSGGLKTLSINFDPNTDPLTAGLYALRVTFGPAASCYIETSIIKP